MSSVRTYDNRKRLSLIIILSCMVINVFALSIGDFRSTTSGLWTDNSTWEVYDGTNWVPATEYPGQSSGNYTVTIEQGDVVTIDNNGITTEQMGELIISGTLILEGNKNTGVNFNLNTQLIYITPNLDPYATIEFDNKSNLIIAEDGVIQVEDGGLSGSCNNNQNIYVGTVKFATCNGAPGSIFTFAELMAHGGTLNAIEMVPPKVCLGDSIHLSGNYSGAIGEPVTYKWVITGPAPVQFYPSNTDQAPYIVPTVSGEYTVSLTVSTKKETIVYNNTDKITMVVVPTSSDNYQTICESALPYTWDGLTFTAAGTQTKTGMSNILGCDSVATFHLNVKYTTYSTTQAIVCPEDLPYIWHNKPYSSYGVYSDTLTNSTGCDSIVSLELVQCPVTNNSECPIIAPDIIVCPNTNGQLQASGVDYYSWAPATGLSSTTIPNPIVNTPVSRKYVVTGYTEAKTNLIKNGDFESGNTGFTSAYTYSPYTLVLEGTYMVGKNAHDYHYAFFNGGDHTTGNGKMMIVNGYKTANVKVWSETITVQPNKDYAFYAYVTPVTPDNPPILQFSINGVILGQPYQSPAVTGAWNKFYAIWNSGSNTTANISIVNQNIEANGNDFALDDIKYVELCKTTDTVRVTVPNLNSTTQKTICSNELPYIWNGISLNSAGTYTYNLPSIFGCDSIATLELTVNKPSYSTTKATVCSTELPYQWNYKSYNLSGIYTDTLVNALGCDSIASLELTVNEPSYSTTKATVCSNNLPYEWNGTAYNQTGNYQYTTTNKVGCDSVATLELTVNKPSYSTAKVTICSTELPYQWNYKSYNLSGIYTDTLVNAVGCDSIASLELTVNEPSYSTTKVTVCSNNLPYEWNGTTYNQTGNYQYTTTNKVGCDSVATLELTVNKPSYSTTKVTVCSTELPYQWNYKSYNLSGIYTDTLVNAVGCDSIATLELTVNEPSYSTTKVTVCSTTLPYEWNGTNYNQTGNYQYTTTNKVGCDSVATLELTVNEPSYSTTKITVCSNNLPYVWNGTNYNQTGNYQYTTTNKVGCDSVATLELTVNEPSYSTTKVTVCSTTLPYEWNGTNYNLAGNYQYTTTNKVGCDSVATLELTVNKPSYSTTKVTVCSTELPYQWNYKSYNLSGIYTDTLVNAVGCDSIATLELTVNEPSYSTTKITVCSNNLPYVWNGTNYNQTGNYQYTTTNKVGCDSIATLELTVNEPSYSTTKITVCSNNLPYVWNGTNYNQTGNYQYTTTNKVGCDSIATLELTVNEPSYSTTKVTVCSTTLPYEWNGTNYNQTGNYQYTTTNKVGCDSVATLELTVNEPSYSTTKATVCSTNLPYEWNGTNYNQTGNYQYTTTNKVGCDSVATLELTVNEPSYSTTKVTVCSTELPYQWNYKSYNLSGIYTDTLVNAVGCDSIATLELTGNEPSYSTTKATVCSTNLPYEWNGTNYNQTGNYQYTTTNKVGCDSVATLELTVNEPSYSTTKVTVCSTTLPYVWNGTNYNQTGNYQYNTTNKVGCDSVATLELTVNEPSYSTTKVTVCSTNLPYEWNGTAYNQTGNYQYTTTNKVGCDSVATLELTVNEPSYSTTKVTVCSNELPFVWNNIYCNKSGIYQYTTTNKMGCDSVATLDLTVNKPSYSTTKISICAQDLPYIWNSRSYSQAGTYQQILTNAVGCDSLATLELTVNRPTYSTTKIIACSNELPYSWNGRNYNQTGIFTVTLTNAVGCDSVATLDFTVNKTTAAPIKYATFCAGDSVIFENVAYKQSGVYEIHLTNKAGCDSLETLIVKVNQPKETNITKVICPLQLPYKWNGITCNYSGYYTYNAKTVAGCDSVVNMNLIVQDPITSTTTVTLCNSDLPYIWNGLTCEKEGVYSVKLQTTAGCDSVAILKLHINPVKSEVEDIHLCQGESLNYNGVTYDAPGSYKVNLQSQSGCDSVVVLVINYSAGATLSQVVYLLPGETYSINGNTYTSEGTYTDILKTTNNCDSVVVTDVVYLPIPNTITPNGDGMNDYFMRGYKVKIYNRNGILLYEGNDGWDGTYKGGLVGMDTYFYVLYYESGVGLKSKEGYITVVR